MSDQATVDKALAFGGIVLPSSAEILGVQVHHGMDTLYALAVRVEPDDVPRLLSASGFDAPLEPGIPANMPPVEGFDPDSGTDIASAQDRLPPGGHRTVTVHREILVDRSDPQRPVVHLWLFTT